MPGGRRSWRCGTPVLFQLADRPVPPVSGCGYCDHRGPRVCGSRRERAETAHISTAAATVDSDPVGAARDSSVCRSRSGAARQPGDHAASRAVQPSSRGRGVRAAPAPGQRRRRLARDPVLRRGRRVTSRRSTTTDLAAPAAAAPSRDEHSVVSPALRWLERFIGTFAGRCPLGAGTGPTIVTEVDKQRILQVLHDRGLYASAEWVDRQLPARVDLERNAGLLATLHIRPSDLADPPSPPAPEDAKA